MALSDEIIIIGIGLVFTYLVLYKKNRFFGNMAFMGLSFALLSFSTNNITATTGIVMLLGSIMNLIFDIFRKIGSKD